MKTATSIRESILAAPVGQPFGVSGFLGLGTRSAIDVALYRLVKEGLVKRVGRGFYVRPEVDPELGEVPVGPREIVAAIVRETGETVEMTGAEAERRMGLSTQQPTRAVYLTTGKSRKVMKAGKTIVEFRHASFKKLKLAGTPEGMAYLALLNRGKEGVGKKEFRILKARLGQRYEEFKKQAIPLMPGWLSSAIVKYEREEGNA